VVRTPMIFISYRRVDSGWAGRIYDALLERCGGDHVFMDVDDIPVGADFHDAIAASIQRCQVLVVVIGPTWLEKRDGVRRIDSPDDSVAAEITAGLRQKRKVVPVLLPGARMPSDAELPPLLRSLTRYNALEVHEASWEYDIERLLKAVGAPAPAAAKPITTAAPSVERRPRRLRLSPRSIMAVGIVAALIVGLALHEPIERALHSAFGICIGGSTKPAVEGGSALPVSGSFSSKQMSIQFTGGRYGDPEGVVKLDAAARNDSGVPGALSADDWTLESKGETNRFDDRVASLGPGETATLELTVKVCKFDPDDIVVRAPPHQRIELVAAR
jgi:TIR domain